MNFRWFLLGFLAVVFAERAYEQRFSRQATRGECKLRWLMTVLHGLYFVILLGTGLEQCLLNREVNWLVAGAGVCGVLLALVVRLTAIRTLGKFWSLHLEIRRDHALITDGIYSRIRHPAYLAIMMEVVAIPLVGNAYYTLALAGVCYIPMLLVRWHNEEREMVEKLGDEYVRYQKRVPAFFPWRWGKLSSPDETVAAPGVR